MKHRMGLLLDIGGEKQPADKVLNDLQQAFPEITTFAIFSCYSGMLGASPELLNPGTVVSTYARDYKMIPDIDVAQVAKFLRDMDGKDMSGFEKLALTYQIIHHRNIYHNSYGHFNLFTKTKEGEIFKFSQIHSSIEGKDLEIIGIQNPIFAIGDIDNAGLTEREKNALSPYLFNSTNSEILKVIYKYIYDIEHFRAVQKYDKSVPAVIQEHDIKKILAHILLNSHNVLESTEIFKSTQQKSS